MASAVSVKGGGTIDADRTLNVVGGDGITANANDIAITASQTTITSVLNSALVVGRDADNQIKFSTDDQIIFRAAGGDGVTFKASGEIEATSLDISGDVDINGTLEADAITVNGTALNTVIEGVTVTNSTTATNVTATSDNSDADNYLTFVGSDSTGSQGIKMHSGLKYNPSDGEITTDKIGKDSNHVKIEFDNQQLKIIGGRSSDGEQRTIAMFE